MSNPPVPSHEPDPEEPHGEPDLEQMLQSFLSNPDNPQLQQALSAMGIDKLDPATMGMLTAQVKAMFSGGSSDPFDPAMATNIARQTVSAAGDATVGEVARRQVEEATSVAELWLDPVTDFAATSTVARAWSRAEWVEQTMPVWQRLVEPVAAGVSNAIVQAMRSQLGEAGGTVPGLPPGMDPSALLGQMEPMLTRMSSSMFSAQAGQAIGALAGDLLTANEVGLPLVPGQAIALLPANIAAFAEGLEVEESEVRIYLAVREAARVRLFAEVPWLASQLVEAVQAYARDISFDMAGIEEAMQQIDPSDPEAMQEALGSRLFSPEPSAAQQAALTRLETYLALVEGWVDVVTEQATRPHLPHAAALVESVRRRRASGGPAERLFSQLVGLELRPRRLRDAANLWAALEASGGVAARDAAWAHPDVAPTAADLDDPLGFVERSRSHGEGDDMDAALEAMLREGGTGGPAAGPAGEDR
ncbi:MAG: zinc-dependent metalloprotease [Oryzihumus sp.]